MKNTNSFTSRASTKVAGSTKKMTVEKLMRPYTKPGRCTIMRKLTKPLGGFTPRMAQYLQP
jgi:hypothetical protein